MIYCYLSFLYWLEGINSTKALEYIQKAYELNRLEDMGYPLAIILLWNEKYQDSYEKLKEYLNLDNKNNFYIEEYLKMLISKGQYYKAKEFMQIDKYHLKDKFKPIWYALMSLLKDDFPNEIKKMGKELEISVNDILKEIEIYREKYKV